MSEYCGLTEQEANQALTNWLADYWTAHEPDQIHRWAMVKDQTTIFFIEHDRGLDECRLIEQRLTPEQLENYTLALAELIPYEHQSRSSFVMLDAPTRCRALITILKLGKVKS